MWFVDCDNKQRQLDFPLFPAAEWHSLTRTLILIQFNRIMRFYRVNNEITRINILLSSSAWAWCLILVTLPAKSVFVHGFCCLLSSPFWVVLLFSTFNFGVEWKHHQLFYSWITFITSNFLISLSENFLDLSMIFWDFPFSLLTMFWDSELCENK